MANTLRIPGAAPALLLAAAAALTLSACGGHGDDKKAEGGDKPAGASRQTVSVATATSVALPRVIVASGTVSAWEEVPVGAETGGLTAVGVYVDEGSYVRQGQTLVKLNDAVLQAQLRQQQAGVQTAEANAARDDAALARAQELKERGFLSQASLDGALADQRASRANLASARAALSETRTRLAQSEIKAPVSGQIISRSVTKGQIVSAGTELFRMVRDGRLELDAQVPETDLPALRAGQTATVTSNEGGTTSGTIRIVTPEVNAQTRLGVARITLSPGSGLKTGMFARASIDAGAQPATVVPTASVLYRNNQAGVFVLNADASARFRPVTVLSRRDDQTSVSGVEPGVRVVVQGAGFLSDGDKVTVSNGQAAPAAATPAAPARK
ncbi:efflux RND transporter periplasmic adaptor subunit [Brevundimonas sp.]|uniref:efflux RND transporter periplasmic adaptor subunit n=1 Tax=Brevundimonas sp. TaxID=1871086 RepID=UPI003D6D1BEE